LLLAALSPRLRLLLTAALLACPANIPWAQPGTQPVPTTQRVEEASDLVFKSIVNRVILDVVVTDTGGKPVHGLTQQDFSITEDGKPQKILSFDVHDLESPSDFVKLPPLPPNTFVNILAAPERGPLYVLLLDLVNTEVDVQMLARQQLLKFIADRPPGTRFAIFVYAEGLYMVQGFTDDTKKLFDAADPGSPKTHIPRVFLYGSNYGRGDPVAMIHVFAYIAQYLDGLRGRKNLMWFSGGFPMQMFPRADDPPDLIEDMKKAIAAIVRARVAIYPIDVNGVTLGHRRLPRTMNGHLVYAGWNDWQFLRPSSVSSGNWPAGAPRLELVQQGPLAGVPPLPAMGAATMMGYMGEDDIAAATGGQAFYSRNDLENMLLEATSIGGNYHTLTYESTNRNYDGKLRNINVKLSKRGYHLSYRRSYYADNPDSPPRLSDSHASDSPQSPPPRKLGDSLAANMLYGAPTAHQIIFRAHVHLVGAPAMATPEQMSNLAEQPAYFRVRRKNRPAKPLPPIQLQSYAIEYAFVAQPRQGVATRAVRSPALEIAAAAFDGDGRMLNGIVENTIPGTPRMLEEANGQKLYRVQQQIDVPLNATSLRVAMRDISTDRIGAMEVDLPLTPELQAPPARP
jgi:VWFA-related protein